jgi:hypothetical protein
VSGRGTRASIGFRVKTGRAIAVVLGGPADSPVVLLRRELSLWDPAVPSSGQPFHAGLGLSREEARQVVDPACAAVHRASSKAVQGLASELRDRGAELLGAGLVVSSLRDPEELSNEHMRAHASEGRLFHEALDKASVSCDLATVTWLEADLVDLLSKKLERPGGKVREQLNAVGKALGPPWRSDEKAATAAAWLILRS